MSRNIKIFWILEFALALLLISGTVPGDLSYVSLFVLVAGILKLSDLEALQFYIVSIPIFVSLPSSPLSDAMSIWRFAVIFFALKVVFEKFNIMPTLRNRNADFSAKARELRKTASSFAEEAKASNYYGLARAAVFFLAAGMLSLLAAQSMGAGIKKIIFLSSIFIMFGIARFAIKSKDDAMKILQSIFASALFILLVGYFQFILTFFVKLYDFWWMWNWSVINAFYGNKTAALLSYSNTWFSYYDNAGEIPPTLRMFSVMPDSHSFSMLMVLFAPVALYYFYASSKKSGKAKYAVVFALMMLAIWFSGSRGAWVGWLGAWISASYLYFSKKIPEKWRKIKIENYGNNRKIYKTVLGSVLLFAVLFPVSNFFLSANQNIQYALEGKVAGTENLALLKRTLSISDMDETSNKGRREIWVDSAVSVIKHPVIGIGMGNFPFALGEKVSASKKGSSAHNIYLDVAVEMGIIGLAAFLYLVWKIFEKLFYLGQKFREEKLRLLSVSLFVCFAWIMTYGFFDVVIFNDKVLTFAVVILAVLYKIEDLENKEDAEKYLGIKRAAAGNRS